MSEQYDIEYDRIRTSLENQHSRFDGKLDNLFGTSNGSGISISDETEINRDICNVLSKCLWDIYNDLETYFVDLIYSIDKLKIESPDYHKKIIDHLPKLKKHGIKLFNEETVENFNKMREFRNKFNSGSDDIYDMKYIDSQFDVFENFFESLKIDFLDFKNKGVDLSYPKFDIIDLENKNLKDILNVYKLSLYCTINYDSIENKLKSFVKEIDIDQINDSGKSDQELLERLRKPYNTIRPELLNSDTCCLLLKLLKFRHKLKNMHLNEINYEKTMEIVNILEKAYLYLYCDMCWFKHKKLVVYEEIDGKQTYVEKITKIERSKQGTVFDSTNIYQNTLFHLATRDANTGLIEFLIKYGANVNAENNIQMTPLHIATTLVNTKIAKTLIENGADLESKNFSGATPLHLTTIINNSDIVDNIVGIMTVYDYEIENNDPQYEVNIKYQLEMVNILIESGANVNSVDIQGNTPVHWSSREGNYDIVEILASVGANVNTRNYNGLTPLHFATIENKISAVRTLLECGADPDIFCKNNIKPIEIAIHYDYVDIINELKNHMQDSKIDQ